MLLSKLRLVAAGKGRTMCEPSIVQAVLELAQTVTQGTIEMVYLGTASYDKPEAFVAQTFAYQQLGHVHITNLCVSEAANTPLPSAQEIKQTLENAHIILCSGGNTLYALQRWKDLGIDKMIYDVLMQENPPVLCGGSAGAVCWFSHAHSDSMNPTSFLHVDPNLTEEEKNNWKYVRISGLGLIPALVVPHYDVTLSNGVARAQDGEAMWLQHYLNNNTESEEPCVGIDEAAALVICNGQARVVAASDKSAVYVKRVVAQKAGAVRIVARKISPRDGLLAVSDLLACGHRHHRRMSSTSHITASRQ